MPRPVPAVTGALAVALLAVAGAPPVSARGWEERQKLLASDGELTDAFGSAAIEGDLALVGAPGDDDNGENAGAAYVYRFDGATWVEEQQLEGEAVSFKGDTAG